MSTEQKNQEEDNQDNEFEILLSPLKDDEVVKKKKRVAFSESPQKMVYSKELNKLVTVE